MKNEKFNTSNKSYFMKAIMHSNHVDDFIKGKILFPENNGVKSKYLMFVLYQPVNKNLHNYIKKSLTSIHNMSKEGIVFIIPENSQKNDLDVRIIEKGLSLVSKTEYTIDKEKMYEILELYKVSYDNLPCILITDNTDKTSKPCIVKIKADSSMEDIQQVFNNLFSILNENEFSYSERYLKIQNFFGKVEETLKKPLIERLTSFAKLF